MSIGARLREERKRLKVNQEAFAHIGGATRNTQINYEGDRRTPDAIYLNKVASHGVDVNYIITGIRTVASNPRELDEAMAAMYHRMHQLVLRAVAEEFATTPLEVLRASIRLPSEENEGAQP